MADPNQQKPTILLLSLDPVTTAKFDDPKSVFYRQSKQMLLERAHVKRATSLDGALKYLNHNRPDGILVADDNVMVEAGSKELLGRIIAFAQYGGTVVFGFRFSYGWTEDDPAVNRFWQESWGVPWEMGNDLRGDFNTPIHLNTFALTTHAPGSNCLDCEDNMAQLLPQYKVSQPSCLNVPKENCWYFDHWDRPESDMTPECDPNLVQDEYDAIVAMSRVGDGYVGFIGDEDCDPGSSLVMLRMFNLQPKQQPAMEDV
ncbi:hypothetical protein PG988_015856 [Apiospora saccharicola]